MAKLLFPVTEDPFSTTGRGTAAHLSLDGGARAVRSHIQFISPLLGNKGH